MDREEGELLVVHTEEESFAIGHLVRPIEHQPAIVHRDLALARRRTIAIAGSLHARSSHSSSERRCPARSTPARANGS